MAWRSSTWAISSSRSRGGGPSRPTPDRHFGLVVDDKQATRRALEEAGAEILPGRGLDFLDPWGNLLQVVQYDEVQFTKTDAVLRAMDLELGKSERALAELRAKGIDPGSARPWTERREWCTAVGDRPQPVARVIALEIRLRVRSPRRGSGGGMPATFGCRRRGDEGR